MRYFYRSPETSTSTLSTHQRNELTEIVWYHKDMYAPRQIGIPNHAKGKAMYREIAAPAQLMNILYCTWELRTVQPLEQDFFYLILPDACTDIIFELHPASEEKAFLMTLSTEATEINLGRNFHYIGIRFLPGVVQDTHKVMNKPELEKIWQKLMQQSQDSNVLDTYVQKLLTENVIKENYLMRQILSQSDTLHKVHDIEALTGYTRRQLQRIILRQTGFTPHDFLKILRFQHSLTEQQHHYYADQSHYIRNFKDMTGITPKRFKRKY